ncbi:non-structural maintenance of chromosomes element 4 homolog A isoform X2 [Manihot esculenta]|uniref:Uncharacterized protein n=1 Tax=Manihot esculenta TaxID=3983 RepID=A0ACB7H374_MANES|nr:non-structural maintenance of chromosomes element 4 homolog A isoform X2 [Manihot esculenta]KAG8646842.1 hypothetical protein MANES_09G034500v8 [Manihot esculenta]
MTRPVKRERGTASASSSANTSSTRSDDGGDKMSESGRAVSPGGAALRSRYLAVKNLIIDEREDIGKVDSDKFHSIFHEVESLHQLVQKPREQVADAEALLDITKSLVTFVKAQGNDGITASDFITCLLKDFGQQDGPTSSAESGRDIMDWKNIGVAVSDIFRSCPGCHTMIGPVDAELKVRKPVVRKRVKPTESIQPEEVVDNHLAEERIDTDNNMATMFNILRKRRSVKLENLVLNRYSFAQTVENLFTLSFLVKDGRAEIKVNENAPRNAAAASAVLSGEVVYRHFIFRLDFKDWKLMISSVGVGEEVMPNRNQINQSRDSQQNPTSVESQEAGPTTPIRKLSRNRGLVLQEETIAEDSSPESDNSRARAALIRRGKRKMR